jgi:hypothetical protein
MRGKKSTLGDYLNGKKMHSSHTRKIPLITRVDENEIEGNKVYTGKKGTHIRNRSVTDTKSISSR